jgi:hypothetical protein
MQPPRSGLVQLVIYRSAFRDINTRKGRRQIEGRSRLTFSGVLLLCLNLGRTYNFHCRRKSKRASKWLGFLVNGDAIDADRRRPEDSAAHVVHDAMITRNG